MEPILIRNIDKTSLTQKRQCSADNSDGNAINWFTITSHKTLQWNEWHNKYKNDTWEVCCLHTLCFRSNVPVLPSVHVFLHNTPNICWALSIMQLFCLQSQKIRRDHNKWHTFQLINPKVSWKNKQNRNYKFYASYQLHIYLFVYVCEYTIIWFLYVDKKNWSE